MGPGVVGVAADFTENDTDLLLDFSYNCTAASAITLPTAFEDAKAWRFNSGTQTITYKLPDTSTFFTLPAGYAVYIYGYQDSSGVPQWAHGSVEPFDVPDKQTYSESNVSTDRTYDANATSVDELADVLGTLIADLRARGIVG